MKTITNILDLKKHFRKPISTSVKMHFQRSFQFCIDYHLQLQYFLQGMEGKKEKKSKPNSSHSTLIIPQNIIKKT